MANVAQEAMLIDTLVTISLLKNRFHGVQGITFVPKQNAHLWHAVHSECVGASYVKTACKGPTAVIQPLHDGTVEHRVVSRGS